MPAPIGIQSLNHVGRQTKHLEESRVFYRDVLGFREVQRPNFDFPGAWLENFGIQVHLIVNDSLPDPAAGIETRGNHLAFQIDDLDEVERRLTAMGVEFRKNVVPERNISQIFFRDPDGYHIEVGNYIRRS